MDRSWTTLVFKESNKGNLNMNVICTICARKGSKGIKNKALRKINNIPLIAYSIKQALGSRLFRKVIVSTDSKERFNILSEDSIKEDISIKSLF